MRYRPLPALVVIATLAWTASASAASFDVTAPDDVNDGTCNAQHCSLREAIHAANAKTDADQIRFSSAATITPASQLPEITAPVFITATPASGRCDTDSAPLRLSGAGFDFPGLVFGPGSDGSILCLATIGGFRTGVELHSDGNAVKRSQIGTDPQGVAAQPNAFAGIVVTGDNNVIGGPHPTARNVISGNTMYGVEVALGTGNQISGNLIGLNSTGTRALPNGDGVVVVRGAAETIVGGTTPDTGNVISGNAHYGIDAGAGRVVGNHIGVDRAGTTPISNGSAGVHASGPAQIERNVISANQVDEVLLKAAATVAGNTIGPGADGKPVVAFGSAARVGVRLAAGADGARIEDNVIAEHVIDVETTGRAPVVRNNLIGLGRDGTTLLDSGTGIRVGAGTTDAQITGNTITGSARGGEGLGVAVAGDGTRIEGNTVGLDAKGEAHNGIAVKPAGITVETTAERTTIADNTISDHAAGVALLEGSADTVVEDNFIGTDTEGMEARANEIGVLISGEIPIPGHPVEARIEDNVISGNEIAGVATDIPAAADVVVEGNDIGVAADGSTPLGNGEGISLGEFFTATPVAPAPAPGHGVVIANNRIAHNDGGDGFENDGDGIEVGHTTTGVTISGNEIFANSGLGIDFGDRGVSANGSERPDVLPPFPVLTNVEGSSVQGTIDLPAGHRVRIELFASAACDSSGHGEGRTPIGSLTLTAPGGVAAFSALIDAAAGQPVVTATATDLDINRTSEFSRCAQPGAAPPPDTEEPSPPPVGTTESPAPGPVTTPPAPPLGIPTIDVPPKLQCTVPSVAGLTLAKAKRRLTQAGCGVGKVTKPKRRPGKRYRLVVKRASHKSGAARPRGAAIGLTLVWKRIR